MSERLPESEGAPVREDAALGRRRTGVELDPEQFARLGHRLVDDVAELLGTLRTRPLALGETPGQVAEALGASRPLPERGQDPERVLEEATRLLLEHSLYNGHPRFFGYITAGPAPLGVLAELLAAAVNPNAGSWNLSPMATAMESQAVRWIAELVGFPAGGGGLLVSGGNVANMIGLWAARAAKAGWDVRARGTGAGPPLRVYGQAGMHTWIQKATDLAGLGTDAIRWLGTDAEGRLEPAALRERMQADRRSGDVPFLVVGTAGSVATGAVDPLPALRAVCDEMGAWLHVDGAYGAFAACAPGAPDDLRGLALADSVALDPHKWLYAPLEAGCVLVRDAGALPAAFAYHPDYYRFEPDAPSYFEHGLQNSRGFRALKVWMLLKQMGREGYARAIAGDIELARRFYELAGAHAELEALTRGLSITTYRYVPADLRARASEPAVASYLDALNSEIRDRIERSGRAFVSNAVVGGAYALRMCIVNFRTRLEDVTALADLTVEIGRAADRELRPAALG
ncbi:MAG TPA: aminotransferase class V-fold PLP-dependent enzyme [Longimicrobiales bacterium]|nr:aminotransferase class V-fold PLP-dependent enzyme [Longimicrobiales bacterium]